MAAAVAALACLQGTSLAQQTASLAPNPAQDPLPKPLPQATEVKSQRPKSNSNALPPAAIKLNQPLQRLAAPSSLALPLKPEQVRIVSLRPLSIKEVENLAEVNNPSLKAIASQVDQAQSNLRAQLAAWYPNISISANALPNYTGGQQMQNDANPGTANNGDSLTATNRWQMTSVLSAQWDVINPQRTPQVAAARDEFEKSKNQYLIALRDLRLQASQAYIQLQLADENVRIGQQSVGASLISLRDAKARYQAGVATKLEVLQSETQLGRDQQLLSDSLASQSIARRDLARLLNLPQDITPSSKEPLSALGVWRPSLEESIVAAYSYREELDNIILDISASNSQANVALGSVQPFMSLVNSLLATRFTGNESVIVDLQGNYGYAVENSIGLNFNWNLFDGGSARAQYRRYKQLAQQRAFEFADKRNSLRFEVEESFQQLANSTRNIQTTSKEVITSREGLRLARLRFQAGVTTQREVVEQQRDLTQAEIRYADALAGYNNYIVELRRRTGLDRVAACSRLRLDPVRPAQVDSETVPVPPAPLRLPCATAQI